MKSPVQSKTLWFNMIVLLLAIWDQVASVLPDEWVSRGAVVVSIINIILRFLTNQPLQGGKR